MVESMTGFGRAQAQADGYSVDAEIRTVNNRYCDVSIKLPGDFQLYETRLRTLLQNTFERGKVMLSVKLEQIDNKSIGLKVNKTLAKSYFDLLTDLADHVGMDKENRKPGFKDLLTFSDVIMRDSISEEQQESIFLAIESTIKEAASKTLEMRRNEGAALAKDLLERISAIEEITKEISLLSADRLPDARAKLKERIQNLITDENYDKDRLELEIALLADKLDITEEIVRLNSHLDFFRKALKEKNSAGRKLNFLMQEMLREINTIGSKSYSAEIAHKVVEAKEIVEIIREQIQNLV
ncbi:MAG: YicC family protein [Balneolales bacterium]|nr:YicC family protein [Balneolales bacterium]